MWRAPVLFLLCISSFIVSAADVIILPPTPVVPPPAPVPPAPVGTPISLKSGVVYDFIATAPIVVKQYPAGLLSISSAVVPANETFRDKNQFFDGATERVYKGPCTVYNVRAAGTGRVVLVLTPEKTDQASKDIKEVVFDADNGTKPQPPPGPTPPTPEPVEPLTSFHVFIIYESSTNLTPAQKGVVYGADVDKWLQANCTGGKAGFRRRDKDSPAENTSPMKDIWNKVQPDITIVPCIAMERNKKIQIVNLEATQAEMIKVLQTYKDTGK